MPLLLEGSSLKENVFDLRRSFLNLDVATSEVPVVSLRSNEDVEKLLEHLLLALLQLVESDPRLKESRSHYVDMLKREPCLGS